MILSCFPPSISLSLSLRLFLLSTLFKVPSPISTLLSHLTLTPSLNTFSPEPTLQSYNTPHPGKQMHMLVGDVILIAGRACIDPHPFLFLFSVSILLCGNFKNK